MVARRNFLTTIAIVLGLISCPAYADSNGNFPGIGSRDAYRKASELGNQGVNCVSKKDYANAIRFYEQAIAVYPHDSLSYHNLGIALRDSGKPEEAIANFKKAIELEPNGLRQWLGLATSYEYTHKLSDAERCYRKAVEIKPDSYQAVGSLGDVLRQEGKFEEARAWLKRAMDCPKCKDHPGEIEAAIKKCDEDEKKSLSKESSR